VKRIGLYVKADPKVVETADAFEDWIRSKPVDVVRMASSVPNLRRNNADHPAAPGDLDCIFVLGGDGTFLSAIRWIGNQGIPIHGVKFGDIGFLAETEAEDLFAAADAILSGRYSIQERMQLLVTVMRDGEEIIQDTVLNDVVINKGALARLAKIATYVDDDYLTTYRADGLIVATPTGSTAYSLAAGGPIIHPDVSSIIITPISPFTLQIRPLIVPEDVCIKLRLAEVSSDILLTFDGQTGFEIDDTDTIVVQKRRQPVRLVSVPGRNYYDILKAKLRWSGDRG